MSALDSIFKLCEKGHVVPESTLINARAELAQLREESAEARAAHVYLDESPVNGSADDTPAELADRIALLVEDVIILRATVAEQARQLAEARKALIAWRICELNENGDDIFTLMESIDEVELYESGEGLEPWAYGLRDAWLAANPAPQEDDERIDRLLDSCGRETDEPAEV